MTTEAFDTIERILKQRTNVDVNILLNNLEKDLSITYDKSLPDLLLKNVIRTPIRIHNVSEKLKASCYSYYKPKYIKAIKFNAKDHKKAARMFETFRTFYFKYKEKFNQQTNE